MGFFFYVLGLSRYDLSRMPCGSTHTIFLKCQNFGNGGQIIDSQELEKEGDMGGIIKGNPEGSLWWYITYSVS